MLGRIPSTTHPELLVGSASGDDAAVWRLDDKRALVSTADFITPVVDDPRVWGSIAAVNSVSDIYAMGATPLFALNLVGWNRELPSEALGEVLLGGGEVATEAGFVVAGGHTIDDPEPKYGMAVTGLVDPNRILTNAGLLPEQDLILTKPLGIGIITTAIKAGVASREAEQAAIESMRRLNRSAAEAALAADATGCTDVTGFGLLGHLGRMAVESNLRVRIELDSVPLLPDTIALIEEGIVPGGTRRNLAANEQLLISNGHSERDKLIVSDAQTSGGLVFGVDPHATDETMVQLSAQGHRCARIGRTEVGDPAFDLR